MIMHTGIISFCDRIRYNIKSSETKDSILQDLERRFHIRILQRHWYKLDHTTSSQLSKYAHWACLRSNGNPYYMFFTRFDDVNIIYFIDKKVQPGYEKPRIILGRGMFHDSLFNDTILDGEMVRRTDEPGWIFLVNDVIAYCGNFLDGIMLPDRIAYAYEIFSKYYIPDSFMDVCSFNVKKYVNVTKNDVHELIKLSEILPYTNRGIYFWSHNNKLKPKLYNFDDGLIKSVYRKVKDCPEFRDKNLDNEVKEEVKQEQTVPKEKKKKDINIDIEEKAESDEKMLWLRKQRIPTYLTYF
jgi:hypothetical protein